MFAKHIKESVVLILPEEDYDDLLSILQSARKSQKMELELLEPYGDEVNQQRAKAKAEIDFIDSLVNFCL